MRVRDLTVMSAELWSVLHLVPKWPDGPQWQAVKRRRRSGAHPGFVVEQCLEAGVVE